MRLSLLSLTAIVMAATAHAAPHWGKETEKWPKPSGKPWKHHEDPWHHWKKDSAANSVPTASIMSCSFGQTAYRTTCCESGKVEVGTTGICCSKGSRVISGQCVPPGQRAPTKRDTANGIKLAEIAMSAAEYGLNANQRGDLCPFGYAACPTEAGSQNLDAATDAYECLDTRNELMSCGGCATLGTGTDCTGIPGALSMGCEEGRCQVYKCGRGWKVSEEGSTCVRGH